MGFDPNRQRYCEVQKKVIHWFHKPGHLPTTCQNISRNCPKKTKETHKERHVSQIHARVVPEWCYSQPKPFKHRARKQSITEPESCWNRAL